jgi:ArsR family transcriptional regulator, cadmium/lead-responsive transcriptional repressor
VPRSGWRFWEQQGCTAPGRPGAVLSGFDPALRDRCKVRTPTCSPSYQRSYHRRMTMIASGAEVERVELAPAAALFRSLGDPARLMIVRRLAAGPARVTDLTAGLGLAQSTVSKHLACLRDCGLVASEPVGRSSLFRLAQPALAEMLAAAEIVLAATGSAVALCPVWGADCCGGSEP